MSALVALVTMAWSLDGNPAGAPADPGTAPATDGAPGPAGVPTPEASLAAAIRLYLDGNAPAAAQALRSLLARGEELPSDLRLDALAYLGDIAYSQEGRPTARNIFTAILVENPDYAMDPYEHPRDVCDYFETLRDEARRTTTVPQPPRGYRGRFPYLALLPGGVHYFANAEPVAGAAVAAVQVAALAANVALYAEFRALPQFEEGDSAALRRYQDLQTATNLAGAAFLGSLAVPPAIAAIGWISRPPPPAGTGQVARAVSVLPVPGGLSVRGTF